MTSWGLLLLVAYIAIGLSPVGWAKATRLAVALTALVVTVFLAQNGGAR